MVDVEHVESDNSELPEVFLYNNGTMPENRDTILS